MRKQVQLRMKTTQFVSSEEDVDREAPEQVINVTTEVFDSAVALAKSRVSLPRPAVCSSPTSSSTAVSCSRVTTDVT